MTKLYAGAALIAMAALLGGTYYVIQSNQSADVFAECRGGAVGGGAIGGPMSLVNGDGQTVTDAEIFTKPTLLYFGYTFCPDVCPTSLLLMETAMEQLGPETFKKVNLVFITVDPERDTPKLLKGYVTNFGPTFIGLTGTREQVAAAARSYRVYFQKVPGKDGSPYLMDHSSIVYLLDRNGRFVTHFTHEAKAEAIAAAVKRML